ncbi:MAG: putative aminohydrolase SsnA, partial [Calditrichaeota bacterium]
MGLLIHNVNLFLNDGPLTTSSGLAVAVEGHEIQEVGSEAALKARYPRYRWLDGGGRLLMPGLINVHMHFYSTFARGLQLPHTPRNFAEVLQMLWWKLDASLDLEAVYYSTLLPALVAVRSGVTAVIDHHASYGAIEGSLEAVEQALEQVGLRGLLCFEVSDRHGPEARRQALEENERYLARCARRRKEAPDFPFDGLVGLHASFTLEEETLEAAADLSRRTGQGCHIHVLEDPVDGEETRRKFGRGVVERLREKDILNERSLAAHCIHLEEGEAQLLAESGTMVAHNPQSNMNNAVGRADVPGLLSRGLAVGLGTDGMSGNLNHDVRTAFLLHRFALNNLGMGWQEIPEMLFRHNPEIYRRLSGRRVGRIEAGYLADLILVDYYPPTPMSEDNFFGHFLFGIMDARVHTSIINGRVVMEDYRIPGIEEA